MITTEKYLETLRDKVQEISVKSCYDQLNDHGTLIDIREKDEVKAGSPKGAVRVGKGLLEMQIGQYVQDENQPIYLLCASGRRSLVAASCLQDMGFKNVYSVKGGFKDWLNFELPFEQPQTLNPDDFERYKRHLLIPEIGEKGQLKLLESKVLIVGAGGIGSPVGWYLAAAGVGHIGIIDNDIVDKTNLQRQILHTEASIGKPKVESAKERLEQLNSAIKIETYNERLTAQNIETIFEGYDLVLDGTDNFNTRYLINDACVKMGIPNIHGSVFRFEGQMSTFWPASDNQNAPCYRCLYPVPPPPEFSQSCAEAGVLGVLPGIIGLLCATEAIKLLCQTGDLMIGKLLSFNALKWDFDTFETESDANCAYCKCSSKEHYPAYENMSEACIINVE